MGKPAGIYTREGCKMKRKKKTKETKIFSGDPIPNTPPKNLGERLGISPEILLGEPKITITGDFLVEIVNHKGIISLSCEQIEVNTRKYIYKICGRALVITGLTDEELSISGNVESIEKL